MNVKAKKQKVEMYKTLASAKYDMRENIENGWYVHTCVCDSGVSYGGVLVVYEREIERLIG